MSSDDTSKPSVGWIGAGVMGRSMCGHLLEAGHPIKVYTRTKDRANVLLEKGAIWAESPAHAARGQDFIFTIVGYPSDVEEIYFGENGVLSAVQAGAVLVDMTTSEPELARRIALAAEKKGAGALDAPVSGGDVGARNAALSIMCGGQSDILEKSRPLLELMGKNIVLQGPAGSGQNAKMCNQMVVAGQMIGVCESLLYARKAGLEPATLLESIAGGAAACWSLDNLAPRIIKRDFEPGFFVEHFVKDMGIALKEAERMNIALPGLSLVRQLYIALEGQGGGRKGTQALTLALERLSGIE